MLAQTQVLSDGSINFLVTSAAITFALFGATRATETLNVFRARPQDYRHLNSLSMMTIVVFLACLFPLLLSDISDMIYFSSAISGIISFIFSIYTIIQVFRRN